jgi:transketolase N-terminal domain/subunit
VMMLLDVNSQEHEGKEEEEDDDNDILRRIRSFGVNLGSLVGLQMDLLGTD